MKPVVLCPAAQLTIGGADRLYINKAYAEAIALAGGVLLAVPSRSKEEWSYLLDAVADAVLFQGGCDIHPSAYGEDPVIDVSNCDPPRDRIEAYVMEEIIARNIPTLAICRGMQMLNVVCGGTLHQHLPEADIETHSPKPVQRDSLVHNVAVEPESQLYHALGRCRLLPVNSMHHQGIKKLGRNLAALARSKDGLVESINLLGHPYCLGVQWHPEELLVDVRTKDLFRSFIQASK